MIRAYGFGTWRFVSPQSDGSSGDGRSNGYGDGEVGCGDVGTDCDESSADGWGDGVAGDGCGRGRSFNGLGDS